MSANFNETFKMVSGSLVLIITALAFSRKFSLQLEKEIIIGILRSVIQLILIGFVINTIFGLEKLVYVLLLLLIMIIFAGLTSSKRAKNLPGAMSIACFSIGCGCFFSFSIILIFGIIHPRPEFLIPFGGIVLGTAMKSNSLALNRITNEIKEQKDVIETALSLGALPGQACDQIIKQSIKTALIPTLDTLKIVGLIQIPGAMTGMLIAGQSPFKAVQLQLLILFMLVSSALISTVLSVKLSYKKFFNKYYQLKLELLD